MTTETMAALDRLVKFRARYVSDDPGKRRQAEKDAALLQALRDDLGKQTGECICPKCGLRHGTSHAVSTEF